MTKPPLCCVRCRGKPEFVREPQRERQRRIAGIEAGRARLRRLDRLRAWPQLVLLSATMMSSERPNALAVSRIAERVR